MKPITIVVDDRIGLLADISYILGKAKINIEGVSVSVVGGKAIIVLTVIDAEKTESVLTKNGYKVMESDVLVAKLADKPGELGTITKKLAENSININNVHIISRDGKNTLLALIVDKPKKARELLKDILVEETGD